MADQTLARPFQLHLPEGEVLHGAQFPGERVFVDSPDDGRGPLYAISLGAALEAFPGGVVLWAEDLARRSST